MTPFYQLSTRARVQVNNAIVTIDAKSEINILSFKAKELIANNVSIKLFLVGCILA